MNTTKNSGVALLLDYEKAIRICTLALEEMKRSGLLICVGPRVLLHTDKGPGVSVTNFEVKYRDAEMVRIHNLDWQMRVHFAVNDPCPAERTNAWIGDK